MTQTSSLPPLVLNAAGASAAAGISKGLLYKLWRNGEGPVYVKIGSDRHVLVADLHRWLESLRTDPVTEALIT